MRKTPWRALFLAVFMVLTFGRSSGQSQSDPTVQAAIKIDEEFRVARLKNDVINLSLILADNFYGTNENGNSYDMAGYVRLYTKFPSESIEIENRQVRITGNTAIVTGSEFQNQRLRLQ